MPEAKIVIVMEDNNFVAQFAPEVFVELLEQEFMVDLSVRNAFKRVSDKLQHSLRAK